MFNIISYKENANQSYKDATSPRMADKKVDNYRWWRVCEVGTLHITGEYAKMVQMLGKRLLAPKG